VVSVVRPQWKAVRRWVEQPGTIQAYEETQLFARIPGYVRLARDNEGRLVHDIGRKVAGPKFDSSGKELEPGETLAELVVPELVEEVRQKKALIGQAEAEVEQAVKAVASAEANIAVARAAEISAQATYERWDLEQKRIEGLAKKGLVTDQNRDETTRSFRAAEGQLASAKAAVQKATADRDRASADVKAAKSRVAVATADALHSEAILGYARIRAPYDGIVTRRKVSNGDFVQPGGGKGDWLFTVARLDPVRVVVAVREVDAELVREKAEVKLTVQALSGPGLSGTVARTSWSLEPGSRTLRVEIDVPNKDSRVRPGMYVYARILGQSSEGWTLPVAALAKQGEGLVCFRIEEGKAVQTPVQIGRSDGQFVEVLRRQKSGSPPTWEAFTGDEAVAAKAAGLTDDQAVQVEAPGK
jgi:RND family efflux transporter MFP subunit